METAKQTNDPAFPMLALDVVNNVLMHAADPGELGDYLTCELRELTGAKTAVILQCRYATSADHAIVSVNPTRRRSLIESSPIQHLANICRESGDVVKWQNGEFPEKAEMALKKLGYGLSIGIPLSIGQMHVGVILLLGLPEERNLDQVMEMLKMISTLSALVLRNAFLYREQDNIIWDRTRQLQESEAKYRLLIDNQNDLVVKFEPEGKLLFVSPSYCRAFGKSEEELLSRHFVPSVHTQDAKKVTESLKKLQEEPYATEYEDRIFTVQGWRWYSWMAKAILDETGHVEAIVSVGRDITDRKHAEVERTRLMKDLSIKNKELENIVFIASHDLKSPLVNIQGFSGQMVDACQRLTEYLNGAEDIAENKESIRQLISGEINESMNFIQESTEKMWALVNGFLHVSMVGSAELDIKPLDMNRMLDSIQRVMSFQIEETGATLDIEDLPRCLGDPNQINQVFSNLISNALKYLDPSRQCRIKVSGWVHEGYAIYSVADNGIGIAKNHQSKVFELFHRLNPQSQVSGEGLGLTIASRILERHDGKISLTSKPGEGTTFYASLPAANDKDAKSAAIGNDKTLVEV